MAFSIAFQDEPLCYPYDDRSTAAASGLLTLGNARESFLASLFQWNQLDYKRQWKHAIGVLLRGRNKSALITTYGSPQVATHLEWWPMYCVGSIVYFQDQLLFYDQLNAPFSIENALSFLGDRETKNPEGMRISEWAVSLFEVEEFASTL
jgi:CdiI N-terminal domain